MSLVPREPNEREREWVELMAPALELAKQVVNTEFVPKAIRGNGAAIVAAILYGDELGLGPMQSLAKIAVIDGKPTLSAEAQRALILAAGHELKVAESTTTRVKIGGRRVGSEDWSFVTWTMDDAKRANLAGRPAWRLYPRQMLEARATAELARLVFADVIGGLAATEEIVDSEGLEEDAPATASEAPAPTTKRRRRKTTLEAVDPPAEEPTPEPEEPPLPDEPMPDAPTVDPETITDAPPEPAPEPELPVVDDDLSIGDPIPVVENEEVPPAVETATPDDAGSSPQDEPAASSDDPPTEPQLKALNTLVGKLREAEVEVEGVKTRVLSTEQLWASAARRRNVDVDLMIDLLGGRDDAGVLHWAPLRDSLTFSEASSLIDVLGERAEKWSVK